MIGNILNTPPVPEFGESIEGVLKYKNIEIKRILSSQSLDQVTFCQKEAEWVVVLQGSAELLMGDVTYTLGSGDHLFIPSLQEHTITKVKDGTLWLAVHIYEEDIL